MMRRIAFLLPLIAVLGIGIFLALGLGRDPHVLPSVLIDQEVPAFDLPPIEGRGKGFSNADLLGKVSLVNVFGSWCVACRVEHPVLVKIRDGGTVPIYGIDWNETDRASGPAWLKRHGDPYALVGDDPNSKAAIAFGVTGAPESFIVDARGFIRYKHTGPITEQAWNETLLPLIERLRAP